MKAWLKRQWRRCVAGAGIVAVGIAAIFAHQPDVTIDDSPALVIKSNTCMALTAGYAVTTGVGVVVMDAGFTFDGASIPASLWSALGLHPFSGCVVRAALAHDALVRGELTDMDTANSEFLRILLADGCQPDKAATMYNAVCLAGPEVWRRHTPASIAEARRLVSLRSLTAGEGN